MLKNQQTKTKFTEAVAEMPDMLWSILDTFNSEKCVDEDIYYTPETAT